MKGPTEPYPYQSYVKFPAGSALGLGWKGVVGYHFDENPNDPEILVDSTLQLLRPKGWSKFGKTLVKLLDHSWGTPAYFAPQRATEGADAQGYYSFAAGLDGMGELYYGDSGPTTPPPLPEVGNDTNGTNGSNFTTLSNESSVSLKINNATHVIMSSALNMRPAPVAPAARLLNYHAATGAEGWEADVRDEPSITGGSILSHVDVNADPQNSSAKNLTMNYGIAKTGYEAEADGVDVEPDNPLAPKQGTLNIITSHASGVKVGKPGTQAVAQVLDSKPVEERGPGVVKRWGTSILPGGGRLSRRIPQFLPWSPDFPGYTLKERNAKSTAGDAEAAIKFLSLCASMCDAGVEADERFMKVNTTSSTSRVVIPCVGFTHVNSRFCIFHRKLQPNEDEVSRWTNRCADIQMPDRGIKRNTAACVSYIRVQQPSNMTGNFSSAFGTTGSP
ncbi:unnamed protein product [Amoebophrya sp. A25]|nr:unnamed protein product [Amoebophrya sp. A25]|eukprot:GSA25T00006029001.1